LSRSDRLKKLYIIDFEELDGDRDDLLVMDDGQNLMPQAERYFRKLGRCDEETGELWYTNIRFCEATAVDADDNEYDIRLMLIEALSKST
jgi:hypothetical protein